MEVILTEHYRYDTNDFPIILKFKSIEERQYLSKLIDEMSDKDTMICIYPDGYSPDKITAFMSKFLRLT